MAKTMEADMGDGNLEVLYPLEKERQNVNIQIVNTKNNAPARVYTGEYINEDIKDKKVVFLSSVRALRIYIKENQYLQFRDWKFITNEPAFIMVMREVAKKHQVFEGAYPQWYLDVLKEEEKNTHYEPFEQAVQ